MPPTGFPMTLLPGPRASSAGSRLANVAAVGGLLVAVRAGPAAARAAAARRWSWRSAATPAWPWAWPRCCAASRVVVAEQNAVPGAANRLLARFAKASAVSFAGTPLPRAVVTGNPVRAEITALGDGHGRDAATRPRSASETAGTSCS